MEFSEEELSKLNKKGLIAGPMESAEEFQKRVNYCQLLKETLTKEFSGELPFAAQDANLANPILEESFELTRRLYDIEPDWIPCYFSNHGLAPWHGGCAWIFQKDEKTPTAAFLQLRKAFFRKSTYLGLYKRKELVAHEISHVGRMMFKEPKFDEMLAYQTSSSWLQRYFGSIIRSSIEAMVFVLSIFMIVLIDIMVVASGYDYLLKPLMWLKLIPLAIILYALIRLWINRKIFNKCLFNLKSVFRGDIPANAAVYRLTDKEIVEFSRMTPDQIVSYAKKKKNEELRWRQIYEYFRRC